MSIKKPPPVYSCSTRTSHKNSFTHSSCASRGISSRKFPALSLSINHLVDCPYFFLSVSLICFFGGGGTDPFFLITNGMTSLALFLEMAFLHTGHCDFLVSPWAPSRFSPAISASMRQV